MTSAAQQAYTTYKRAQVMTASPEQLVLMLYDAARLHVKHAAVAMSEKDSASACSHLEKSQAIVVELQASLDMSAGHVSHNLMHLYGFIHAQLFKALLNQDVLALGTVAQILTELKDAWSQSILKRPAEGSTVAISL